MKCLAFFALFLVLVASAPLDNQAQEESHEEDPGLFALSDVPQPQVTDDLTRYYHYYRPYHRPPYNQNNNNNNGGGNNGGGNNNGCRNTNTNMCGGTNTNTGNQYANFGK